MTIYKKLKIAIYAYRKHSKDRLFRVWANAWLQGIDRTTETAEIIKKKGRSIAGLLGEAAWCLSSIEGNPKFSDAYEKAASVLVDSAVMYLKKQKEPDFEFEKYLTETYEFCDYVDPSLTTDYRVVLKYGGYEKRRITQEQFREFSKQQNHRCAICGTFFKKCKKYGTKEDEFGLIVDHDKANSNINKNLRGLLCMHCNWGLGHFRESPKNLSKAIEYLLYYVPENQR